MADSGSVNQGNKSFYCLFCHKPKAIPVSDIETFKEHMEDHHKVTREHLLLLALHFTDKRENDEIIERVKEQLFMFLNSVQNEAIKEKKTKKSLKCPFCKETFERNTFNIHLVQGHYIFFGQDILVASSLLTLREIEEVMKRIQSKAMSMELSKSIWNKEVWACRDCGKRLKSDERLASHVALKCIKCERCLRTSIQLKTHKCVHETFKCKICNKKCKNYSRLKSHEKKHMKKVTFRCEDCPKEFLSKRMLEIHLQRRRTCKGKNKTNIQCDSCTQNFSTRILLHKHKKENDCQTIIVCKNCQRNVNEFRYNVHMITCMKYFFLIDMMCKTCFKCYPDGVSFGSHLRKHKTGGPYNCETCMTTFALKEHITKHQKEHKEKKHKCELCKKTFHKRDTLTSHKNIHLGVKPWECNRCLKQFYTKLGLVSHAKISHPHQVNEIVKVRKIEEPDEEVVVMMERSESDWICKTCKMVYNRKDKLKRHIEIVHLKKKPHICLQCDKSFTTKYILETHMQYHTGEKPHACLKCPRRFLRKRSLRLHTTKCFERKPKFCSICNRSFILGIDLRKHMKEHSQVKNGKVAWMTQERLMKKCDRCDFLALSGIMLMKHRRNIHPGEKFFCNLCCREFLSPQSLNYHRKLHLGIKYRCTICSRIFKSKSNLWRHEEEVHIKQVVG